MFQGCRPSPLRLMLTEGSYDDGPRGNSVIAPRFGRIGSPGGTRMSSRHEWEVAVDRAFLIAQSVTGCAVAAEAAVLEGIASCDYPGEQLLQETVRSALKSLAITHAGPMALTRSPRPVKC